MIYHTYLVAIDTIDSLFTIKLTKKQISMIWPPLEPPWWGDYNAGIVIIIITIIITNISILYYIRRNNNTAYFE
jgi:hypothetical protein